MTDRRVLAEALFPVPSLAKDWLVEAAGTRAWLGRLAYEAARGLMAVGRPVAALRLVLEAHEFAPDALPEGAASTLREVVLERCFGGAEIGPVAENRLLREFGDSSAARETREAWRRHPVEDRVRLRQPIDGGDAARQGDLIVLKEAGPSAGEKGVILVAYTESIGRMSALFDVPKLARDYQLVFEPSWGGYQGEWLLRFLGDDLDVVVQAPAHRDHTFVERLEANLAATRLGFGDWTDPALFRPADGPPEFDLATVSGWYPFKRFAALFRMLRRRRREGRRRLRVALVGYEADWRREHVEALMEHYRVADQCTLFQGVPQSEVARIVSRSRVFVLLSRREGGNRAIYEAMFCDTPVAVYERHTGVNLDHVRPPVGERYAAGELNDCVEEMLGAPARYAPRDWAMRNTGFWNSTERLNALLRERALASGHLWSADIAAKTNSPNLRYAESGARSRFEREYERLEDYLLG